MRIKMWLAIGTFAALSAAGGCSMSEADRCPSGYFYVSELKVCCPDEDDNGNKIDWNADTKQCVAAAPIDTDTPDTPTDTSTDLCFGGDPSGFGVECTVSTECEGNEANFCAVNPLTSAGYCSITDCVAGCCPSGYECCDCGAATLIPQEVACLSNADADMTEQYAQCTCEP